MSTERDLEKLLKALANRKRIGIIRYLRAGRASVGEIAKAIKLSIKATSHHLQQLSATGYVASEQQGLYVYYTLSPNAEAQRVLKVIL